MLTSEFGNLLDSELKGFNCIYDKGLLNLNKPWILTIANKNVERRFLNDLPEFEPFVRAFKKERGQIERVFGVGISRWNILQKPFKGRGLRYDRIAQIFLLTLQLTNLIFKFDKSQNPTKTNLVDNSPPRSFTDILKAVDDK